MKKLISLALAVLMILSMATVAFAAGEDTQKGSITITNIALGTDGKPIAKYTIYKLLDVTSINHTTDSAGVTSTTLSYVANDPVWKEFFQKSVSYNVDDRNTVTLISTADPTTIAKNTAAAAINWVDEKNVAALTDSKTGNVEVETVTAATASANGIGNLKFKNLDLGYYLIASDMGILCGIDSTTPDGQINAKNSPPTATKQVQEDTNSSWGDNNHADIGQVVNFNTTIIAQAGAANYVAHDIMDPGLTFNPASVKIYLLTAENNYTANDSSKLNAETNEDYVVHSVTDCPTCDDECSKIKDTCTFEIYFNPAFLNSLHTNNQIYIEYSATLNHEATIGQSAPNKNQAFVSYGDNFRTQPDETETYTYRFDIVKVDGLNRQLLDGAEFVLSTTRDIFKADGTVDMNKVLPLAHMNKGEETGIPTYHLFHQDISEEGKRTTTITAKGGMAIIMGLDADIYYLTEIKAPAGYNMLPSPHEVEVDQNHNWIAYDNEGKLISSTSGVIIENNAGTELPSTGAMGTAMFITFGMFVVLGTGLLLVTKKRMSMIRE